MKPTPLTWLIAALICIAAPAAGALLDAHPIGKLVTSWLGPDDLQAEKDVAERHAEVYGSAP